jgi:parallel beta-helix repeat protein
MNQLRKQVNLPGNFDRLLIAMSTSLLLLISCKKEADQNQEGLETKLKTQAASVFTTVHAGQSINAAVNAAPVNSIILVEPGVYLEAISFDKPGMQIIGIAEGVIIQNPGGENNGIRVGSDGDGFVLKQVTIRDFLRNGLFMSGVDNFLLSHVTAINCGVYGLYPVRAKNGKMEHCKASGHTDSGIYIGQSANVEVSFNHAFENVIGIEIENCENVTANNNQVYNNVGGLLVTLLPPNERRTVLTGDNNSIINNHIYNNNLENFASGGLAAFVPKGTGILIVGSDRTLVEKNNISENNFVGIATVSTAILGLLAGAPLPGMDQIEPNPNGTRIINNVLNNNGTIAPAGLPLPATDLLWDGSGTNNCWKNNKYSSSYPGSLPQCN